MCTYLVYGFEGKLSCLLGFECLIHEFDELVEVIRLVERDLRCGFALRLLYQYCELS